MLNFNLGANSIADVLHAAWLKILQLHFVDLFLNLSSIISKAELSSGSASFLPSWVLHETELFALCLERKKATTWEKAGQEIMEDFII